MRYGNEIEKRKGNDKKKALIMIKRGKMNLRKN